MANPITVEILHRPGAAKARCKLEVSPTQLAGGVGVVPHSFRSNRVEAGSGAQFPA